MQSEPLSPLESRAAEVSATIADPARRAVFDGMIRRIDPERHRRLQEKYRDATVNSEPAFIYKYLDVAFWLKEKVGKAFALGLVDVPPIRVLDLGTGGGHFPALCNALGHEAVGLDIANPFYAELCDLMGVDRRTHRIRPSRALETALGAFDLVTAFAIKFDALGRDDQGRFLYWSLQDWSFFIDDLTRAHMRYPGRACFQLNRRIVAGGSREPFADVIEACRAAGAALAPTGEIMFAVDRPLALVA